MPIEEIRRIFTQALTQVYPDLPDASSYVDVARSTQDSFGHFQFNSAMKLAKPLKQNPRQVAEAIKKAVETAAPEAIERLEVAGPGFINITLTPSYISRQIDKLASDPRVGVPIAPTKQKIVIDFSSPNTAKEMHVGHLRSTIIGDCLARLLEFLGHDVVRLNHIGDWGTQFGMLIAYLKEEAPKVLDGTETTDLTHLVLWYKASKKRFDDDEAFRKRAQLEVVELQGGNPSSRAAWEIICDISRKAYQEIYDILDIHLIERGESFYNPMLADVVRDLESKGLVELSEGAKCIFIEGFQNRDGDPLPLMIQKSDGAYNYDTTDMAAIRHRIRVEGADRIIIVTDAGQAQHFKMIFKAAEMAKYLDPEKVRCDHVPFGLVLGPDGKKFKTRQGDTERLLDLLTAAVDRARAIVDERSSELSPDQKTDLAQVIGIGAIKYADLSCNRIGDYTFSYDRMLRFEGNTAVFLLYAYVRVAGIKRKVGIDPSTLAGKVHIQVAHPSEITLALHLLQFPAVLEQLSEDLLPNRLTDYLYELAERFHAFFRDCRVEGSAEQNSRLLLCEAVAQTMRRGLNILGVRTVERM